MGTSIVPSEQPSRETLMFTTNLLQGLTGVGEEGRAVVLLGGVFRLLSLGAPQEL